MRYEAIVTFVLDEDSVEEAEAELESKLNDMLMSTPDSPVRGFEIEECYAQETLSEEDGY